MRDLVFVLGFGVLATVASHGLVARIERQHKPKKGGDATTEAGGGG